MKAGFLGLTGLSLGDLLRLCARAVERKDTAVILIWLDGGPSQLETYDPKPEAPAEYRGPYGAIHTNVPGIRICEMLPQHARHADKMVFVRSLHHDNGDHFAGAHWMLTGRFGSTAVNLPQKYPSVGSYVAARPRAQPARACRPTSACPRPRASTCSPATGGGVSRAGRTTRSTWTASRSTSAANSTLRIGTAEVARQLRRRPSRAHRGRVRPAGQLRPAPPRPRPERRHGRDGPLPAAGDRHDPGRQGPDAFDLDKEDPQLADRYGQGPWGRYTLMARRLVEAGVTFVTVDMPHWDDHSQHQGRPRLQAAAVDRAVGALHRRPAASAACSTRCW